jgi:hypothetical protein
MFFDTEYRTTVCVATSSKREQCWCLLWVGQKWKYSLQADVSASPAADNHRPQRPRARNGQKKGRAERCIFIFSLGKTNSLRNPITISVLRAMSGLPPIATPITDIAAR